MTRPSCRPRSEWLILATKLISLCISVSVDFLHSSLEIRIFVSLVVRISACHVEGSGSIPPWGGSFYLSISINITNITISLKSRFINSNDEETMYIFKIHLFELCIFTIY